MPPFSAETRKAPRCILLKWVFRLLIFLIAGSTCGNIRAEKISTIIRVCVTDARQKVTDKLSIVLFNAPDKISSKKPDADGCFRSGKVSLDTRETYFLAAQKGGMIDVAKLNVNPEDNDKIITTDLKLAGLVEAPVTKPGIEICIEDENKKTIPINSPPPSGDSGDFTEEKASNDNCARVKLGAASEYRLTLSARGATAEKSTGSPAWLLIIALLSLLLILGLLFLTRGISTEVKRIAGPGETPSGEENVAKILVHLRALSQDVGAIKNRIEEWPEAASPGPEADTKAGGDEPTTSKMEEVTSADTSDPAEAASSTRVIPLRAAPPLTAASQISHRIAEARRKYSDFISGAPVDYFCLMPLGSSSASQMVEGERVELREQEHGTYIAFSPNNNLTEAWVFPLPGYQFTAETFSVVFPNLTAQEYETGNFEPKRAVSVEPKLWRIG